MIRRLGTLVIVLGLGLLAWTAVVYLWKDPFTAAYSAFEQRRLEQEIDERLGGWRVAPRTNGGNTTTPRPNVDIRKNARTYRRSSGEGEAIARLEIPRLDLEIVVVNGTESGTLRRGPGRHLDSSMPGEGGLVYIAGHRTTFGAPFSDIDSLRRGDKVVLELPYASVEYRITEERIVDQHELSVLRSRGREELALQACHPRFFASERYIVYARPVNVVEKRAVSASS